MSQAPSVNIEAIILAGGDSRRFKIPEDSVHARTSSIKALMPFGRRRLIDHIVDLYSSLFSQVTILSNVDIQLENTSVRVIPDGLKFESRSSLAGILNALMMAQADRVCIGACDMPFVQKGLLQLLKEKKTEKDLLIPLVNQYLQPMPAVYRRSCLHSIQQQIASGNHRILDFFSKVSMEILSEEEMKETGTSGETFYNINTWEHYEKAIQMLSEKKKL